MYLDRIWEQLLQWTVLHQAFALQTYGSVFIDPVVKVMDDVRKNCFAFQQQRLPVGGTMCHWCGLSPKRGNKQAHKCVMYVVCALLSGLVFWMRNRKTVCASKLVCYVGQWYRILNIWNKIYSK